MKVAVLGAAGGIGQALALLLKTQLPSGSELSLYDIAPVTPGVAVDLSHIPTAVKIKGFSGEDARPALQNADVVLISAGVARKPGMDRSDLFNVNAGIVKNLVQQIAETCPKSVHRYHHQPGEHHRCHRSRSAEESGRLRQEQTVRRNYAGYHPFQYLRG